MIKSVNWLIIDEEVTLGYSEFNGKKIFIVEISERCDAPDVYLSDSLKDAILRFCFLDPEDLDIEEEKEFFDRIYKQAEEEIKRIESKIKK